MFSLNLPSLRINSANAAPFSPIGAALGYAAGNAVTTSITAQEGDSPSQQRWKQSPVARALRGEEDPMQNLIGADWGLYYNQDRGQMLYQSNPIGGLRKLWESFRGMQDQYDIKESAFNQPGGVSRGWG